MRKALLFAFLLLAAYFPDSSFAQGTWSELGAINPKLTGNCKLARDGSGRVYAALGKGVFKWDGMYWVQLGADITGTNESLKAITIDPSGNVYVAGNFRGNKGYAYVAKWDGVAWNELGTGSNSILSSGTFSASINALACDAAGNVYAAGDLGSTSSIRNYVAKWDGTSWKELGKWMHSFGTGEEILTLTTDPSGNVYAAGELTNSSGYRYVAKWDGSSWSQLDPAALKVTGTINVIVCDASGLLYAAGDIKDSQGKYYIATWNGTSWGALGNGAQSLAATDLIYAIAPDGKGNVYAAGQFKTAGEWNVVRWDGTAWQVVGDGTAPLYYSAINSILCDTAGRLIVGAQKFFDVDYTCMAQWDGTNWSIMGTPNSLRGSGQLNAVVCGPGAHIYATGAIIRKAGNYYVAHWDGYTWSEMDGDSALNSGEPINALVSDKIGNLYASCFRDNIYSVAKWSGKGWSVLDSPKALRQIDALSSDNSGNVYAAGRFSDRPAEFTIVKKWDGSSWNELTASPGFFNGPIYCLATDQAANLYAVGGFSNGTGQHYVAKWDGFNWTELGSGAQALKANGESRKSSWMPPGMFTRQEVSRTATANATSQNGMELHGPNSGRVSEPFMPTPTFLLCVSMAPEICTPLALSKTT